MHQLNIVRCKENLKYLVFVGIHRYALNKDIKVQKYQHFLPLYFIIAYYYFLTVTTLLSIKYYTRYQSKILIMSSNLQ